MSKGKRYTQQFKEEAVKQVVEWGYSVAEVAERLGISTKALYNWKTSIHGSSQQVRSSDDQAEIARLKAELMRVTEERDILKRPYSTLQACPSKVRLHP
jgi:transposase